MQEKEAADTAETDAKKRLRSGTEKRQNTKRVTLRLSDKQREEIEKNAAAAGVSVGGFIRKRCCTTQEMKARKLIPLEVHEVVRLRGQLGRLGGNLNQIVRRENFHENLYAGEYRDALAGVRDALASCHNLLREAHRKMAG